MRKIILVDDKEIHVLYGRPTDDDLKVFSKDRAMVQAAIKAQQDKQDEIPDEAMSKITDLGADMFFNSLLVRIEGDRFPNKEESIDVERFCQAEQVDKIDTFEHKKKFLRRYYLLECASLAHDQMAGNNIRDYVAKEQEKTEIEKK